MPVSDLSPISLAVFFYADGSLVQPARLFFTRPDTEDPITVYTDAALGIPFSQPVLGTARCPPVYVGAEPYRVRVFDSWGTLIEEIPWLPGAQSSTSGGSGMTDDEREALIKTGDFLFAFNQGHARPGYVRCNGGLIGNVEYDPGAGTPPHIERLNEDCQALFTHLWGQEVFGVLPVLPARGSSGSADWNANKAITLPDLCGRSLRGIDGMGGPLKGRLAGVPVPAPGAAHRLGSYGGLATLTLTINQIPSHTHPDGVTMARGAKAGVKAAGGGGDAPSISPFATGATGGGLAHPTVGPYSAVSVYIKL